MPIMKKMKAKTISQTKAQLALTMLDTGKTAHDVLWEAGLKTDSEFCAELDQMTKLPHVELFNALGAIARPRFAKYSN